MFAGKLKKDVLDSFTLSELKSYIEEKLHEEVQIALPLVYCDNNEFIYKKTIVPKLLDKLIGIVLDDTIIYIKPFQYYKSLAIKFDKVNGDDLNLIMPNDLFKYPQDAHLMTEREKNLIFGSDSSDLYQIVTLLQERDVKIERFAYTAACIIPHFSDPESILIYFPATGLNYSPMEFFKLGYTIPICSKIK